MAEYEYKGPQPAVGDDGELVHPGDAREFSEAPDCPPWELVPGQEPESPPPPPPPPPVTTPAAPAAKPEGM